MNISSLCECCSDYISPDDDYIACNCGRKWCSIRCAKHHGYVDRKKSSYCDLCKINLFNFTDLIKDENNNS